MSNNTSVGSLIIAALVGSAITYVSLSFFSGSATNNMNNEPAEIKPLYWVAPMDANYRKDKPGKSPMGMDLVPVYGDDRAKSDSPGTIRISPEVVNNLGVRLATARYGTLNSQISTVGYVKYDEDLLVHIHPRVEGWIEKLHVTAAGDPVIKGQALYDLYSPALVNAQEELLLALGRDNKRLIKAAEDRLKALQLPHSAIRSLKKTGKVKQRITFFAPQSGVIDNLNIREGFFVKPGKTLMSIGKLDQVWVEAEVFERQASLVKVGLPVTMTLAYLPGEEWLGKVDYVYPTLDPKTRTVKVRLRFKNNDGMLKPNMFAQVIIHAESDQTSLLIPKEAVIRTGKMDRVVLALGEGRFKSIEIKVGRYDDHFAQILSGLDAGDEVVSSAQFLLDSESSKSSDFKRMHYPTESEMAEMNEKSEMKESAIATSVWVEATINNVMAGHRMLNVSHAAIAEWDWPAMTMDFTVAAAVDISLIKETMALNIEIQKNPQGDYEVIAIKLPESDGGSHND